MKKKRPVNLNLFTIKFPLPAIISILHRISGFFLFLCIPLLLWMLQASLASAAQFSQLQQLLTSLPAKLILILVIASLLYHLLAGIRHLLMDAQIGETLNGANLSSKLTLILSIVCTIIVGYWLW